MSVVRVCINCGHPERVHCCIRGKCDATILVNPRQIITADGTIKMQHDKVDCSCNKFTK